MIISRTGLQLKALRIKPGKLIRFFIAYIATIYRMTTQLLIDNLAFANKQESLTGSIHVADCERLGAFLQSNTKTSDKITYQLNGKTNSVAQHFLHLKLTAHLTAICQRCLSDMALSLTLEFNYILTNIDDVEIDESDDYDGLNISQTMDLLGLIEDEIMTALPISPKHEISAENSQCTLKIASSGEKQNPFAVLKGLLKP